MQILYNLKIISLSTVVLLKIKNECIKMALRGIFAILDDWEIQFYYLVWVNVGMCHSKSDPHTCEFADLPCFRYVKAIDRFNFHVYSRSNGTIKPYWRCLGKIGNPAPQSLFSMDFLSLLLFFILHIACTAHSVIHQNLCMYFYSGYRPWLLFF